MINHTEALINGARAILNDYAARNKLLGRVEEYADSDLTNAIDLTIQEINYGDVYRTSYTLASLMSANPYLVQLGVAKNAFYAKMVEKTRNSMPYSDGAGYVDKEGNLGNYQAMYSQLAQKYEELRVRFKSALNVHSALA